MISVSWSNSLGCGRFADEGCQRPSDNAFELYAGQRVLLEAVEENGARVEERASKSAR